MFDQTTISGLALDRSGADLVVSWASSAPPGTTFQVYLGGRLSWWGTASAARFPWPASAARIDVGAVADGEGPTDFSGALPAASSDRGRLSWLGGSFLGAVAGYRVFGPLGPGLAVSYTRPIADVAAYHGAVTDGYDLGGYDLGGYGQAASSYSWTSEPLAPGVWTFAVVPHDAAGNLCGAPVTATVTIAGPPRPPAAAGSNGRRPSVSYSASSGVATISWSPSP